MIEQDKTRRRVSGVPQEDTSRHCLHRAADMQPRELSAFEPD
jgi:hypothetical protein